ncbi:hypothetical protein [Dyadobacter chenhuakuii]|uniref:Uncharacterized protein n=1 Tax=Dyadobacter chenhuakuii TaxID=2909339 RepID=A0A9X1Q880_9BACT|nr:hypothetical protein [Dyadobacter chenhuakuii]MCF2496685.1 hypothetical protein [Dyadobacter chenhuakuii]
MVERERVKNKGEWYLSIIIAHCARNMVCLLSNKKAATYPYKDDRFIKAKNKLCVCF